MPFVQSKLSTFNSVLLSLVGFKIIITLISTLSIVSFGRAALTIFALGVIGLASRRFKKKA
jgi:hypothetical protein